MGQNIFFGAFKESFLAIWKNKLFFALLFVLQILFFAAFSLVNLNYQMKILENAKAITDYISQQKIDEASVAEKIMQQKSILGDEALSISRNFNEMLGNFRLYLFYLFLLLLFFMSIMWALSHKLTNNIDFKKTLKNLSKILVVLLFHIGLVFLFFYLLFNISIADIAAESSKFFLKYILFLVASIILAYFMFISLALAGKTELNEIVQKTLSIGIKKMHYLSLVYFVNIFLLGISAFLLYYFVERNAFVVFLSMVLIVSTAIFSRILLINVVEKLDT